MKLKKFLMPLLLLFTAVLFIVGCTPETEYDNLEITKIETSWQDGFAPFPGYYLRTFDFKKGNVYDTWVTDEDVSNILEYMSGVEADDFNNPKQVTTFTEEQATKLYEKIKSLGFLTWKDRYVTDDIIDDGGSECVTVYFADGTAKSTYIYFEYPPKYKEIRGAFEEYLGVNFYLGS